jgi:hypothetical protein
MEILEEIAADDPIIGSVDAQTIGIANTRTMIGRWRSSRVFKDRIFDDPIINPSCGAIRIGLDELRPSIEELHVIDMGRLRTSIEDNGMSVNITDSQVRNHRVAGIAPDTMWYIAVVGIIHTTPNEDNFMAAIRTTDGDIVDVRHVERIGEIIRAVRQQDSISITQVTHGTL